MALARACAELRTGAVRELNVRSADIDDDGARVLAEALEQNDSLTYLSLRVRLQQQWWRRPGH